MTLLEFIKLHGQHYPYSENYATEQMAQKECYKNSYHKMQEGYEYWEGYVWYGDYPELKYPHAWNVKNGKLYDFTHIEDKVGHYVGIHVEDTLVHERAYQTGIYGAFSQGWDWYNETQKETT